MPAQRESGAQQRGRQSATPLAGRKRAGQQPATPPCLCCSPAPTLPEVCPRRRPSWGPICRRPASFVTAGPASGSATRAASPAPRGEQAGPPACRAGRNPAAQLQRRARELVHGCCHGDSHASRSQGEQHCKFWLLARAGGPVRAADGHASRRRGRLACAPIRGAAGQVAARGRPFGACWRPEQWRAALCLTLRRLGKRAALRPALGDEAGPHGEPARAAAVLCPCPLPWAGSAWRSARGAGGGAWKARAASLSLVVIATGGAGDPPCCSFHRARSPGPCLPATAWLRRDGLPSLSCEPT